MKQVFIASKLNDQQTARFILNITTVKNLLVFCARHRVSNFMTIMQNKLYIHQVMSVQEKTGARLSEDNAQK
jgi:hypothetical protein